MSIGTSRRLSRARREYRVVTTRMSIYVRVINYEMWDVITNGPFMPSTVNVVTNELMPKPRSEGTEAETKKVQINFKAINTLHCALTPTKFNKLSSCTTAKQVWEKLRIIYEGVSQVKESKIALLTHNYEMFKMEPGEDITSMLDRRNRRLGRRGFRKDQGASWKIRDKNDSNKKEKLICYECKKPGHFKSECPFLKDETPKKNKKSKKAMVAATWSDSDTSSSEAEDEKSEERANICLMAQDDETEVSSSPCDISIDDLQDEYDSLYDEFEKLFSKYKTLKKKAASIENDLEKMRQEFNSVFEQRNILQIELEHSKTDFEVLKLELDNKSDVVQKLLDENIALKCLKNES
ncbi:zinc finger protein [Theobroma cacao]|nr:zinc finger protein [Theobroma cacao]